MVKTDTAKRLKSRPTKNDPNGLLLTILALIAFIGYFYDGSKQPANEVMGIQSLHNESRLEELKEKSNVEELTDEEWEELCDLLATVRGIVVNDCRNCKNYVKALLQLKHYRYLKSYEQRPDKELDKGIRKYRRRIEEHYDKIADPEKYFPDWKNFHPNRKKDLVNNHWPNDIKRLKEQQEILECILKNRQ